MDEDREIIERFKSGHTEAFSELVGKYTGPVLNLVNRISDTREDSEDLVQEIFLRAYKGLPNFKGDSRFFTWLYRIAINVTLRARERKNKYAFQSIEQKMEANPGKAGQLLLEHDSPDRKIEKVEMREHVRSAIRELDEDHRTVVILYRYHDLSYEEIASVLNLSVSAVKSRLYRARRALKDKLQNYIAG